MDLIHRVIFSMPSYVVSAGIVGLVFYSIACGIPILMIAYLGSVIQTKYPGIFALGDFVQWRFGRPVKYLVAALMIFNMSIGLLAEYTSIGDLFEYTIGTSRLPIVLTIAIVTSIYTAVGGLYISILTDVPQGIFSVVLLLVLWIYVAVTYRPGPLPTLDDELGANYWGYASIAAMPISLFAATIFSEAPWQRVWASADDRTLKRGALWASIGLIVVCFAYGFGGFLALWANYPSNDPSGSTAFFSLLAAGQDNPPTGITVVAAVAVTCMCEGLVDSYQNGIVDTISSTFFRGKSVWYPRVLVFLINIPLVVVSLKGYNVNSVFLIGNVLVTIATVPLLLGLWEAADGYITAPSFFFGFVVGFFSVVVFGYLKTGDLYDGMQYCFFDEYDWPTFVLPLVFSFVGVALWVAMEGIVRRIMGKPFPILTERKAQLEDMRRKAALAKEQGLDTSQGSAEGREEKEMSSMAATPVA